MKSTKGNQMNNHYSVYITAGMTTEVLKNAIIELLAFIPTYEAEIKDWSVRVYKTSEMTVSCYKTEGESYSGISVDTINERRRNNRIENFKEMINDVNSNIKYCNLLISKNNELTPKTATEVEYDADYDDFEDLFADPE